uniref:All-trans retinoic acid-induced differentiation factor-like n=1 Tax=Salarias fasciatus TaxID=181472 RepID=A0A672FCW4_SALFA
MKAVYGSWKLAMLISTINICCNSSYELSEPQVCTLCGGTMLNSSEVGHFCWQSAGHIDGRCCWRKNNTSDRERIIGLDLSNCALTFVDDLKEASTAIIIDLSLNHIVNMSDTAFQGYTELNYMILPPDLDCPGGNASWESVGVNKGNRVCVKVKKLCATRPASCPCSARRTPSVPPTVPASSSAAVPETTTDTSVFERESSRLCRCFGVWRLSPSSSQRFCGSPKDGKPSRSEAELDTR